MSMKILVTGANGFVGGHLVRELSEHGYEVIAISGSKEKLSSPFVSKYVYADLTNFEDVKQIDFTGIMGVVHLAGLAAVGPSFDNPLQYVETNMGIEINLYEAAQSQGVKPRFIIVSSGSLYGPHASLPLTEESNVLPNSPYAVSKLGQEQLAAYYGGRGFEYIIARPFNHIGPGQSLGFIAPDLTKQVIEAGNGTASEVRVGNLESRRDYTDVRDIVRAYRLLLEHGKPGGIYNICSGRALSGQQILDAIFTASGSKARTVQDPERMRPADTPAIYGSTDKLRADTGWEPQIDILEATIGEIVTDWQQRIQ